MAALSFVLLLALLGFVCTDSVDSGEEGILDYLAQYLLRQRNVRGGFSWLLVGFGVCGDGLVRRVGLGDSGLEIDFLWIRSCRRCGGFRVRGGVSPRGKSARSACITSGAVTPDPSVWTEMSVIESSRGTDSGLRDGSAGRTRACGTDPRDGLGPAGRIRGTDSSP
ncbi:unnamed protein product [Darwinula stevensoni]|uniref:Secreted protein n=1 Tax=Darwinula stevensoni TaxID=69355 RepID=A0A7R9FQZ5_9CRUS|nr:unnamed protein product [Darwinula stevensoni]CAG0900702.1 unnamed protein product [Darwinula stevensoni]